MLRELWIGAGTLRGIAGHACGDGVEIGDLACCPESLERGAFRDLAGVALPDLLKLDFERGLGGAVDRYIFSTGFYTGILYGNGFKAG